jgi:hypothetical protein
MPLITSKPRYKNNNSNGIKINDVPHTLDPREV